MFPHLRPSQYSAERGCRCDACVSAHREAARRRVAKYRKTSAGRARARTQRLSRTATRDDYIANYKVSRGCTDCGYKAHPRALDFDHLGEKSFTIGGTNRETRAWSAILAEIEKCEVVCSNCHRIRTFNREQAKKTAQLADALLSA